MYTRCILLHLAGDVMYHSNCLNKYTKKLKYDVQALMESDLEDGNSQLEEMIQEVITAFDIDKHGYALKSNQ